MATSTSKMLTPLCLMCFISFGCALAPTCEGPSCIAPSDEDESGLLQLGKQMKASTQDGKMKEQDGTGGTGGWGRWMAQVPGFVEYPDGTGGCEDTGPHQSGWLTTGRPYTPAQCSAECSDFKYFTIASAGDKNCKCNDDCDPSGHGHTAYKQTTTDAPTAAPTAVPTDAPTASSYTYTSMNAMACVGGSTFPASLPGGGSIYDASDKTEKCCKPAADLGACKQLCEQHECKLLAYNQDIQRCDVMMTCESNEHHKGWEMYAVSEAAPPTEAPPPPPTEAPAAPTETEPSYIIAHEGEACDPDENRIALGSGISVEECATRTRNCPDCGNAFEVDSGNHNWCGCGKKGTGNSDCREPPQTSAPSSNIYTLTDTVAGGTDGQACQQMTLAGIHPVHTESNGVYERLGEGFYYRHEAGQPAWYLYLDVSSWGTNWLVDNDPYSNFIACYLPHDGQTFPAKISTGMCASTEKGWMSQPNVEMTCSPR